MNETRRKIARGFGWSAGGNFVLRVGSLAASVVVARIVAPNEYGLFAVAMTVWLICGTLAELGLGADLVRSDDFDQRAPTVATLGMASSAAICASLMLLAPALSLAFNTPGATRVIQVMAISILVFGVTIVPSAALQRKYRQDLIFSANAAGLLASSSTMIALALSGVGAMALAVGQVAGQVLTGIVLLLLCRVRIRFGFNRAIARESLRFSIPLAAANLVSWLLLSVDNVVVARVAGTTALGLYAVAFNISSWPMSAVGQAIRAVALPAFAQVRSGEGRTDAVKKIMGAIWALSICLAGMLAVLGSEVIEVLYGKPWLPAASALVGLGIFGGIRVVFDFVATLLIATGRTRQVLLVQIAWLASMVPAMWFGIANYGLAGAGWAHVAVAILIVLPAYAVCLRGVGVSLRAFFGAAIIPFVSCVPMLIALTIATIYVENPFVCLGISFALALILYAAPMAYWSRHSFKSPNQHEALASELPARAN